MSRQNPDWLEAARSQWANTGSARPDFADEPGPGQESVWDYPRPPVVVPDGRTVVVGPIDHPLATTGSALRLLETASPPTFYVPAADIELDRLVALDLVSVCEWKGQARYWALVEDQMLPVAWDYPNPFAPYGQLAQHLAFYPGRIECRVDAESVRPQSGGFYGGWVTKEIVGPYKGEPGTQGW